jgi:replicative DNA helicase
LPRKDRLPPHSVDAEEAVLGAILVEPSVLDKCTIAGLLAEDFFREHHGWVYSAAIACRDAGLDPGIITVAAELNKQGKLDEAGGELLLVTLASGCLTPIGVETHIKMVNDTSRLRRTLVAAGQIAQLAYSEEDPSAVLEKAQSLIGGLVRVKDSGLEKLTGAHVEQAEGPEWGIPAIDSVTMGMAPGRMTIIAAPTGQGKSMLSGQIVRQFANTGGRAAIFTMEMSNQEYLSRMAHALSGVRMRSSKSDPAFTPFEQGQLDEARSVIDKWDLYSSDKSSVSANGLVASVRALAIERPVGLVLVDYLQLMARGGDAHSNDAEALKAITGALKSLAMEVGCHVVVVSQMNRASLSEMRRRESSLGECIITEEKFPLPFAESLMGGAVENDADLLVMLQRHPGEHCYNHVEVCVVKNRNGITGHSMMISNYALARLETMDLFAVGRAASGDLYKHRALLKDQGLYIDD